VSGKTSSPDLQATISIQKPDILAAQTEATTGLKTASTPGESSAVVDEINSETISVSSPVPGGSKILSIGDLSAYRDGTRLATLSGSIPFQWNRLKWDNLETMLAELPTDQPLHASLTVGDLSILRLVSNSIDPKRTGGKLTVEVDANTGGKATALNGSVKLADASIALLVPQPPPPGSTVAAAPATIDTYLKEINADIGFGLKGATIASFKGKSSVKGDFDVTGTVNFGSSSNLNLKVALNGLQINEHSRGSLLSKNYSSAAQGKITGAVAITGPFDDPLIANADDQPIVVSDATVGVPSAPSGSGTSKPVYSINPKFKLHLAVGAPRKPVTVKNALLNAEVSGIADIGGNVANPEFHSDLTVNKGKVILGGPVLRIDPGGTVVLNYPTLNTDTTPGAEPVILTERVDLTARTTIPASPSQLASTSSGIGGAIAGGASSGSVSSGDTTRTDYHITVHIVGYLGTKDLTTDYQSDPRLDRPQILALLTPQTALLGLLRGGSGSGDIVAQQLTAIVNSVGVGMLLDPVETNIAQALGLSSFVVDYSPDAPVVVTLTKPLGHRFEASFKRSFGARAPSAVNSLTSNSQYQLKLSFSLSRRLRLSVSTDDQYNNTAALEGVINFN